jgi:hypothetical protein
MFPAPHVDDAFVFVVEKLRSDPNGYIDPNSGRYDVWLPGLVWKYLLTAGYPQQHQIEYQEDSELKDIWRAFYDAVAALPPRRPSAHSFLAYRGWEHPSTWPWILVHIQRPSMARSIRSSTYSKRSHSVCCAALQRSGAIGKGFCSTGARGRSLPSDRQLSSVLRNVRRSG